MRQKNPPDQNGQQLRLSPVAAYIAAGVGRDRSRYFGRLLYCGLSLQPVADCKLSARPIFLTP